MDIHLSPKIGPDGMVQGPQKEGVAPGQNVRRYLARAWDVRTGPLVWVEGERTAGALFMAMLTRSQARYRRAAVIPRILDN